MNSITSHLIRYRYYYAIAGSVLASLLMLNQRVIINNDAVVYLVAAETLLEQGVSASATVNPNPLLPALIAFTSKFSGMSLLTAADTVNMLLHVFMVLGFIYLVRQLGGSARIQLLALPVILLQPGIAGFREMIMRDTGYWAAVLFATGLLVSYQNKPVWRTAALWIVCLGIAMLFRSEAIALFGIPVLLYRSSGDNFSSRLEHFRPLLVTCSCAGMMALGLMLLTGQLGLLANAILHVTRNLFNAESYTALTTFETWAVMGAELADSLTGTLTWPFLLFMFWCLWQGYGPKASPVMKASLLVSALIPLLFLLSSHYLTGRYVTLFVLLLMCWLPFAINQLYTDRQPGKKTYAFFSALALVLFIDSFFSFGHSRAYLTNGIAWVEENVPEQGRVLSNVRNLTYSIDRPKTYSDSETVFWAWQNQDITPYVVETIAGYDFFVEDTFWNDEEKVPHLLPDATEIMRFTSERGNRLVIYQLN